MAVNDLLSLYEHYCSNGFGVTTDSRTIGRGDVFFALRGASFNGNEFTRQVLNQGASLAVIDDERYQVEGKTWLVQDALQTLQDLARHHRRSLPELRVIGITGSNGKTTTKELVSHVVSASFPTLFTEGNLNNHIGVPLTLLKLRAHHRIAVIEMGANHQKEIELLSSIALPDFGLITSIGKAHLEGFGGVEGIIKGKSELAVHVRMHGGFFFANADSEVLMNISKGINRMTYGTMPGADLQASAEALQPAISFHYRLQNDSSAYGPVRCNLSGKYNLDNVLSALAIGLHLGIEKKLIHSRLASYEAGMSRSQWIEKAGYTIFLDAYNANPTSLEFALRNFMEQTKGQHHLLLIGDMFELGAESASEHARMVGVMKDAGVRNCWSAGPLFAAAAEGNSFIKPFQTSQEIASALRENPPPAGTMIFIKGSRGMKMEKSLEGLV